MRRLQLFQKTEPYRCLADYWKRQRDFASRAVTSCLEVRDAHGKSLLRSYPVAPQPLSTSVHHQNIRSRSHPKREAGYSSESRSSQSRASVGARRRTIGSTPKRKQDVCGIHRANLGSQRLPSRKNSPDAVGQPPVGSWTDVWNQSQSLPLRKLLLSATWTQIF